MLLMTSSEMIITVNITSSKIYNLFHVIAVEWSRYVQKSNVWGNVQQSNAVGSVQKSNVRNGYQ